MTGRPLPYVLPLVRELAVGEFVVAANGATVCEIGTGAVLDQSSLPGHVVRLAVESARRAVPGLRLAATTLRGMHVEPGFDQLAPLSKADAIVVDDATPRAGRHGAQHGAVRCSGWTRAPSWRRSPPRFRRTSMSARRDSPAASSSRRPVCTRAAASRALCERLGVEQRDVVAFGDGLNDHEMLIWAGHGVAMGNADDATKAIAAEVTASNDDDGVASVVERLVGAAPGS